MYFLYLQGIDIREYVADVEAELKRVEDFALKDYIKEAANIASLHYQIKSCDNALEVRDKSDRLKLRMSTL